MIGLAVACTMFSMSLLIFLRRKQKLGRWAIPLFAGFAWMLYLALRPGPLH